MRRVAITPRDQELYEKSLELYESAFPDGEIRDREYQLRTMEREEYHFEAIFDGDQQVGILGWWELDTMRYIEHLAIFSELRNGGYGRRILESFKSESDKLILLEVEQPEDEITRRRIGFYERMGYILNSHYYEHPPYQGDLYLPLMIMTNPRAISEAELNDFKERYFPLVHFRHSFFSI